MKCRRVRHLLLDFVDGLGNEALHAEVERHLAVCTDCETFAADAKKSLALLRRAPVEPLDENFNWRVRLAIHREQKTGAKRADSAGAWVRAWNFRYVASTGVAFALVLGAGIVVTTNRMGPSSGPSLESAARNDVVRSTTPSGGDVAQDRPTRLRPASPNVGPSNRFDAVLVTDSDGPTIESARSETRGAIDLFRQEVAMDSVIDARLEHMTPEMRTRCIRRQIHRLQAQLEDQRAPAAAGTRQP